MNWKTLFELERSESSSNYRSRFDRDFDRIIFSHPFRRLQDKTQVHPLPEYDFVHNRLTHSLEVSSVGRSLGRAVGQKVIEKHQELKGLIDPNDFGTVVASAALAHDIGNPPFGHSGESSISDFFKERESELNKQFTAEEWADLCSFEGNAQGFRLITQSGQDGLKLTLPTIAAFTKYPRPAKIHDKMNGRRSQKKFGFYESECETFTSMAEGLELIALSDKQWVRHPLAFLVEAADDICYNIIDLEDGCNLGLVSTKETIALFARILGSKFKPEKLESIPLTKDKIGLLRALTIGELIGQCVEQFMANEASILDGTYDSSLTDDIDSKDVLDDIVSLSIEKIYRSAKVVEIEAAGYGVLNGLLEVFVPSIIAQYKNEVGYKDKLYWRLIPSDYTILIKRETSLYGKFRILLDFISGMTDSYAVNLHRKINGTTLPGMH